MSEETKKRGRPRKIPTIVLDNDDVIVNFKGGLLDLWNQKKGTCLIERDIKIWGFENCILKDARGNEVNGKELHDMFVEYQDYGLYAGLPLLESVYDALKWMKKLGYKIIILTARNPKYGKDTEVNIKIVNKIAQFIDDVFFEKDKVSKLQELSKNHKIALFADDRASTVNDVAENCKVDNVVLVERSHNETEEVIDGVTRVRTLFECVRFLKDYGEVKS